MLKKRKIVHLITGLKVGGAESLLCDLVRLLNQDEYGTKYENHVIFFHAGPNIAEIEKAGIKCLQIKGIFFNYDPVFFLRLYLVLRKIKPDCIHSSLWAANFAGRISARLLGIPIVCVLHLASNAEAFAQKSFLRDFLDKKTLFLSDKLVAVSSSLLEELQSNNSFMSPDLCKDIKVIQNGIDSEHVLRLGYEAGFKRSDYGIAESDFVIGCVGRLIPRKKHEFLIRSFANLSRELPGCKLMLVGDGILEEFLKRLVRELGIENKVIFAKADRAYGFYPLFDCFALVSQQEGLSISLLEACSFGLPAIIAGNGKHEIIENGITGYIIEPDNEFELGLSIKELYINAELRNIMGGKASSKIQAKFDLNVMVKQYSELYESVFK